MLPAVTIRTRFTPPVTVTPGVGQGEAGDGGVLGRALTAIVMPDVEAGPVVYAPAGRPGDQWIAWAGVFVVLAGAAAWRLLRRRR